MRSYYDQKHQRWVIEQTVYVYIPLAKMAGLTKEERRTMMEAAKQALIEKLEKLT